jgi:hypothetical protein
VSIWSSPYPFDGIHRCPTVTTAGEVVRAACMADGEAVLDGFPDLKECVVFERIEGHIVGADLKPGIGINAIRRTIGLLWERMSDKAKRLFLAWQWNAATHYLEECLANVESVNGENEKLSELVHALPPGPEATGFRR